MTDDFRFHSFLASLSDESREEFLTALLLGGRQRKFSAGGVLLLGS